MNDIYFSSLVLNSFYLRAFFVSFSIVFSIKTIGIKNIRFLKKYIHRGLFSFSHLFYWFVAFVSLWYFQYLIGKDSTHTVGIVFKENPFLSWLIIILLLGVLIYAFIDMLMSISIAKETRKDIEQAKVGKTISIVGSFASLFIPGGVLAKGAFWLGSWSLDNYVDNKVSETLTSKIKKNFKLMLLMVMINLIIVIFSVYLIQDEIVF